MRMQDRLSMYMTCHASGYVCQGASLYYSVYCFGLELNTSDYYRFQKVLANEKGRHVPGCE